MPDLSLSVDSVASDEGARPSRDDVEDSALSRSRGKEKHITAEGLEKMVLSIKEKTTLGPLSPTLAASLPARADVTPRPAPPSPLARPSPAASRLPTSSESCRSSTTVGTHSTGDSDPLGSDTSVSSSGGLIKTGSIVHGFSPSQMPSSLRSKTRLGQGAGTPGRPVAATKTRGMFSLGAGSSGDEESSFEERMSLEAAKKTAGPPPAVARPADRPKPKPSFKEVMRSRRIDEGDSEDEDVIESEEESSAIEEDDGWEDSASDSGSPAAPDENLFKRVDSAANLASRRSMLTLALTAPQRALALASRSSPALRRSRTSSPTGPSLAAASPPDPDALVTMHAPGPARPRPIAPPAASQPPPPHSPRTTRRNMLATELPESLRKHLLWERKQKSTTANAFLKRRHTAQNMAQLHEYPGEHAKDATKTGSWSQYDDAPWEYNSRGW